jgi:hypothetical protein
VSPEARRGGFSTGDVLLVLAVACLGLALAYPAIARARMLRRVDDVAANVDSLRAAAQRYHRNRGRWPRRAPAGILPSELNGVAQGGLRMEAPGYRLAWEVWEMPAEATAAPPPPDTLGVGPPPQPDTLARRTLRIDSMAAVTVHTGDARILGLLLDRYGDRRSFVRDSSWTMILRGGGDGG